jgi:hypothetical protein
MKSIPLPKARLSPSSTGTCQSFLPLVASKAATALSEDVAVSDPSPA